MLAGLFQMNRLEVQTIHLRLAPIQMIEQRLERILARRGQRLGTFAQPLQSSTSE
ncbi:hypothetical protein D3C80_2163520 [compost metagenome]